MEPYVFVMLFDKIQSGLLVEPLRKSNLHVAFFDRSHILFT